MIPSKPNINEKGPTHMFKRGASLAHSGERPREGAPPTAHPPIVVNDQTDRLEEHGVLGIGMLHFF